VLAATTPVSAIGFLYVAGALVTVAGLLTARARATRRRGVTRAGIALVATAMVLRVAVAGHGKTVTMTRGPRGRLPSSIASCRRTTSRSPPRAPSS